MAKVVLSLNGEIIDQRVLGASRLLLGRDAACDLVVDGPYDRTQPDTTRRWIGSRNQGLHALTGAYDLADPRFHAGETLEIRLVGGEIVVNGWPWKGRGLP